jgi:uncharacterized protein YxeA
MKKIIAMLVAVMMITAVSAQYRTNEQQGWDNDREKDVVTGNGRYKNNDNRYGGYTFTAREMEMQIFRINREYDRRIQDVKNKFFMSRYKKEHAIMRLEAQRRDEIRSVYAKFNDSRNNCDDRRNNGSGRRH